MSKKPLKTVSFHLDPGGQGPLHEQLYRSIRQSIEEGHISMGERLPSSRSLALQLNLSRNTVARAYEDLIAEAYLSTKEGAGTFVAYEGELKAPSLAPPLASVPSEAWQGPEFPEAAPFLAHSPSKLTFRLGMPALDKFPTDIWHKLLLKRFDRASFSLLRNADPQGYPPLREAIANYLSTARGVICSKEQVIVTNGSQQAFVLAGKVLLSSDSSVIVEEPGYIPLRGALRFSTEKLSFAEVDEEGLDVSEALKNYPEATLAAVAPAAQFPLGYVLSNERRQELIDWAYRQSRWILEDDYDSEFRYLGKPLPSLQGQDPHGRVIYVGSFSKVLSPSLRLGYLVAPPDLVAHFISAKVLLGRTPSLEQAVVSDFIEQGHFARHVRRMRSLYQKRRDCLVELCQQHLSDFGELGEIHGGMHGVFYLKGKLKAETLLSKTEGLACAGLSRFQNYPGGSEAILLGFSPCSEERLLEGVEELKRVFSPAC